MGQRLVKTKILFHHRACTRIAKFANDLYGLGSDSGEDMSQGKVGVFFLVVRFLRRVDQNPQTATRLKVL